jgi:hypothetical protein
MPEPAASVVTVRNEESRFAMCLLALCGLGFGLVLLTGGTDLIVPAILAGAPSAFVLCRIPRLGLRVTPNEVIVWNLGRTYRLRHDAVDHLAVKAQSHPSGFPVSSLAVQPRVGKAITVRGTSSYSEHKVRLMEEQVRGVYPKL